MKKMVLLLVCGLLLVVVGSVSAKSEWAKYQYLLVPEDETVPAGDRGLSEDAAQPDEAVGDPPEDTDGERPEPADEDVNPAPEGAS